ncbi:MAG: M20/M25/M40 family metallo-hydrolase [Gemmatimonadales bacterium]|nr:M20/M25/M40 family metallo-hydrolase [Gemmatimonadales bacterium]NIN10379.1 M20/M25/M40 family metallo-hydrolase [Gemmatimonadales bacterium]NIN49171.1 M20/M25/M40 family metallo-hydrolase [Gemmatimonadales bacterium]NIP06635.1 M20/M25/M40 family metallo-hydrolase [Gemmatimonadales bacterium]NIQ99965.1 M20/M25/M40 family metallo-hydrolase [Gemmatimonadales bacterium]
MTVRPPVARLLVLLTSGTFLLVTRVAAQETPAGEPALAPASALTTPGAGLVRAHLRFLSADLLMGRAPGTPGAQVAAHYIAAQFEALGLEPGGPTGSYFQPVRLLGVTPEVSLVLGIRRQTTALEHGRDFVAWPERPDSALSVDGEIVFVGYGIQAAEWDWDDYKGTPLAGKILLMLVNDPGLTDASRFNGRTLTYYGRWTYKLEQAARMGAVGAILIHTDKTATYPWSVVRNSWTGEQIMLDRRVVESLQFGAWMTADAARRILAETGRDFEALVRRAQQRQFRPIGLGAHAVVRLRSRIRQIEGANVVGRLDGADPDRRHEAVVLTAHYDHLGVGLPVDGDSIYNGAEDNASGVAALLAAAAGFSRAGTQPGRTLLFIATTAEEAGLLGAEAYVTEPIMPLEQTVAVLNIDRANLRGATHDAVALGSERSTLGQHFRRAAAQEGLEASRDPNPGAGQFYRSDHFPFARAGVPVLAFQAGAQFADRPPDWGAEQEARYTQERYHQPSDEFREDFAYEGALQQVRLLIRLGWSLAAGSEFPEWHPDSEYRSAGERLRLRRARSPDR